MSPQIQAPITQRFGLPGSITAAIQFVLTGRVLESPFITRLGFRLGQGLNLQESIQNIGPHTIYRPTKDNLYVRDYIHDSRCDCLKAESQAVGYGCTRSHRNDSDLIQVHQGVVGSADQVVKKASERDHFARLLDIICYEMEAVAIMETIPCLTVRGISDYSDGHKNDDWHSYASLSAAVCTKELLKTITVPSLSKCPLEVTQDEIVRWVQGALHQTAERNLNTIVDRYGLVQELIVPELYKMIEQTDPETDQRILDSVAPLETLQKELGKCLNKLRSRANKQAKRRDNSEAMRESWKLLRKRIDERTRWVNDVSKATQRILWSTASTSRRFFLAVGRKGNRAIHDAGQTLQYAYRQAFEHLKLLMNEFKFRFRANAKDQSRSPPQNGSPLESISSREDVSSHVDGLDPYVKSPPIQHSPAASFSSERNHSDGSETQSPLTPSQSGHGSSAPEPNSPTGQSQPSHPASIKGAPTRPSAPNPSTTSPSQVPPTASPPPVPSRSPPPTPSTSSPQIPPTESPPQAPLPRRGHRHYTSENIDPSSSSPPERPRQSVEYGTGTPQQDHMLLSPRNSIQPQPQPPSTPRPVHKRESESFDSSTISTPPQVPSEDTPDTSPSRSVRDLVSLFQTPKGIMGCPPP
ncbi:hypothetical protein BO94DRAFT_578621 [Aspergillus sclerotioniger CBS 115572]|uniref:Nucleoside phosphorylase domain-containing protein n=1 Tax=Aspergillus sclerotioniger CBS 115572 TaxID=1450535 RepID=A0A317VGU8_9EURO|nr:hypothetical protein BO94DRAFT_578621 [Aspergillus sclerotioniger CBS 115572]PWY72238.1 hypothetical protein BO94DRAFT_578621 [Aspergillus sclerotioniger CBS 115572]